MKKFNIFCSILIVICIPLTIISLSTNIVVRSPEAYSYYLNDSCALDNTSIGLSSTEMADEISDFMMSIFDDEVTISEDTGYSVDPIFDDIESEVLLDIRTHINIIMLVGIIAFIIMISIYIYFLRNNYKEALFNRCKLSMVITGILMIANSIALGSEACRAWYYAKYIGITLKKESTLYILATSGSPFTVMNVAITALIIIVALLIFYVTWRMTKPRILFTRR